MSRVLPTLPEDWSGAWAREAVPETEGLLRSVAVSGFLAGQGGLTVRYQPLFETGSGPAVLYGLESLVRGPAASPYEDPDQLLEFFRRRGRLGELDEHCLAFALGEAAKLASDGIVIVNVEAVTMASPSFERRALGLADAAGIDPARLVLDVRLGYEEAPIGRLAAAVVRARAAGLRVCFDEVRASAAPVRLLEVATPDYLKLSRSVVRGLWRDPWTRQCVEGALRLGETLGFRVVAQGVDSERDDLAVKRCGIRLLQGSFLVPPVTAFSLVGDSGLLSRVR